MVYKDAINLGEDEHETIEMVGEDLIPQPAEKSRGSKSQRSSSTSKTTQQEASTFWDTIIEQSKRSVVPKKESAQVQKTVARNKIRRVAIFSIYL